MKSKDQQRVKLERDFYKSIPKARRINPVFRGMFQLFYEASLRSNNHTELLNIYSSKDLSSEREDVFKSKFFHHTSYTSIDFSEDRFISTKIVKTGQSHSCFYTLPYQDESFDVIITTKVILEHASDPYLLISELARTLRKGGYIYLIAPHIRRQHQQPYDYFRFTESAIRKILESSSLTLTNIKNTGGFMAVIGYYFYFLQRGLGLPSQLEKVFDFLHYWLIEPFFYALDSLDNGYGKDMTLYFMVTAQKD